MTLSHRTGAATGAQPAPAVRSGAIPRLALLQRVPDGVPLFVTLLWLAVTAWARPLALPDEGRYVGVAWAMVTSGDWVVPTLNGLPYFHKPPLFYWITAAALSAFGNAQWAARLAPLLGAAIGTTALYLFARRWWGRRVADMGLLVLATQPLVFVGAQFANLDMLVAGCIGAATLAFAHAALVADRGGRSPAALAAGYAFAAFGVLAKGLIGVVLPGMVLVAWMVAIRKPRLLAALLWLPGIALFAVVAAPWFIAMQMRFPEFAHYFFVVQHFSRYAQGGFNNQQPWWFYPVVLAVLAFPWSAWLPGAIARGAPPPGETGGLRALPWLWLVLVTLFFSLPQSKLIGYILPVAWPFSLLVAARVVQSGEASTRTRRLALASVAAGAVACLVAVGFASVHPLRSSRNLGSALASRMLPGDHVAFLEGSYFDVPFYARLRDPVWMVDAWDSPEVFRRDNWRKELADAGRFAPGKARASLLTPEAFAAATCDDRSTWVLASRGLAARYPVLRAAEEVAVQEDRILWRIPGLHAGVNRPDCAGRPSANSAGRS